MGWVRDKQLSGNRPFLKLAEMAQAGVEGEAFLGIQVGEHPQSDQTTDSAENPLS